MPPAVKPLSNWEMASRLSFFLWSSIPDDELRRAAAAGELSDPGAVAKQVKRMLADPKARRLATEFFGQWLGFYHFDQFRGVDTSRFPEFTDEVKSAMYDEAVSFFEYIVRKDRPVREMLYADYTFLNKPLAKYLRRQARDQVRRPTSELVDGANAFHRGGTAAAGRGADRDVGAAAHQSGEARRLGAAAHSRHADCRRRRPMPARFRRTTSSSAASPCARSWRRTSATRPAPPATCASIRWASRWSITTPTGRWREQYADGKPIDDSGDARRQDARSRACDGLLDYLKTQGQQVRRTLVVQAAGLRARPHGAASDQPLIEQHGGSGRRRDVLAAGDRDRDQQAVPQPAGTRRRSADAAANQTAKAGSSMMKHRDIAASFPARRRRGAGAAVAGVAAAVRGRTARGGVQQAAAALRLHLLLERRRAGALVGEGQRRGDGARARGCSR